MPDIRVAGRTGFGCRAPLHSPDPGTAMSADYYRDVFYSIRELQVAFPPNMGQGYDIISFIRVVRFDLCHDVYCDFDWIKDSS